MRIRVKARSANKTLRSKIQDAMLFMGKGMMYKNYVNTRGWPSASKIEAKILSKFELNLDHPGGK